MDTSEIDIEEVRDWAQESGEIAKHFFNRGTEQRKTDQSWVTQADMDIEQLLTKRISASYPQHGIMGEERGVHHVNREFVWAIDPLDGTDAFVLGLPIWGVSIGVMRSGVPYAGLIYLPLMDEYYWADADGVAYWNGQPIKVKQEQQIDSNDWIAVPSNTHRSYNITFPGKTRSLGSIASYFCYIARGSAVGALLGRPRLWDIAAGVAILQAAGGMMVDMSGASLDLKAMLHGEPSAERIVLATPSLLSTILGSIEVRPR